MVIYWGRQQLRYGAACRGAGVAGLCAAGGRLFPGGAGPVVGRTARAAAHPGRAPPGGGVCAATVVALLFAAVLATAHGVAPTWG